MWELFCRIRNALFFICQVIDFNLLPDIFGVQIPYASVFSPFEKLNLHFGVQCPLYCWGGLFVCGGHMSQTNWLSGIG